MPKSSRNKLRKLSQRSVTELIKNGRYQHKEKQKLTVEDLRRMLNKVGDSHD